MEENTDLKQKDADHALVLAVSTQAAFDSGLVKNDDGFYERGVAFPLLQALQEVNKRLLEDNSSESMLFDVVLITTDSKQQQERNDIISSTRHHGLEVGKFCFCCQEDFIENLQKNNVHLFLSTNKNEVSQAMEEGRNPDWRIYPNQDFYRVFSTLLDENSSSSPTDQLRVLFCEDTFNPPASPPAAQIFAARLGKIRQKFHMFDSPVCITLLTCHGGRESCGDALKTLRSNGVSVDEAYCLAGAPRSPIVSLLRPHFILHHNLED